MVIEKLTLFNFKNYDHAEFSFSNNLNLISGLNGSGKTNLLDAIHYLSLTKSAFNNQDIANIQNGKDFFSLKGIFQDKNESHEVLCNFMKGQKKNIKVDKVPYDRISEHIGRFPCVLVHPYDTDIVREGSEDRRKFFDTMISQVDPVFLRELIEYNHFLKHRNSALKMFAINHAMDRDMLDYYDSKMIPLNKRISHVRKSFLEEFMPYFQNTYRHISRDADQVSIDYHSSIPDETFEERFVQSLDRDLMLQRTTLGIHRDDFIFRINGDPLKNFGSQGQQKSFVIGLKVSQFEILKFKKQSPPILLLDDIFDKLDDQRINRILELISGQDFQQVFLTDASVERMRKHLSGLGSGLSIFNIEKGRLINKA